ncbi:Putative D-lactate dehydrogenase, mitochondrial [Vanrija pseudolonga]|uniref:D-lactate dehydrogenase, mitochondrial n=1 Tax=Vanrija pseudolonga TaxID=143232 RepID=A0AAF0XZG0_9TREE|nr:Putative D-lactate dehydrogenase, mitochondrial [Vanrija pseudolonga]
MSVARTILRALPRHAVRRTALASPSSLLMHRAPTLATTNVRHGSSIPPRTESFTTVTKDHVAHLRSLLSSETSLLSTLDGSATTDELVTYNDDWMNKYHGKSQVVVRPKTTEEVSKVLKYCYDEGIAVVPQGGNTGLVGGGVPVHDEVVIQLGNLNKIRSFDPVSGVFVADAGVVLEVADNYLAEQGFIFPLDLGAKGSCQIGGNVATNAGGLRLLRYGSLHGTVLGLEVVLPDGTVYNHLSKLRKDNTGFDLKQLFIGSEGSLGIITAISILCPRRPKAMNVAVFSVPSYEAVQKVFAEAKDHLGEILSAFEFWDKQAYSVVRKHQEELGGERKVFETEGDFYCLIETGGSNAEHDEEKLGGLLEHLITNEIVLDGVLAQDTTQFSSLWSLREGIPEACGKAGPVYKYDLSIPVGEMYEVVETMRTRLRERGLLVGDGNPEGPIRAMVGYGHMGDGNVHINIVANKYAEEIENAIEPYVYEVVSAKSGSISAEHGLGVMKAPHIHYSQSDVGIGLMHQIKKLFDPKGLLNPYKYIV